MQGAGSTPLFFLGSSAPLGVMSPKVLGPSHAGAVHSPDSLSLFPGLRGPHLHGVLYVRGVSYVHGVPCVHGVPYVQGIPYVHGIPCVCGTHNACSLPCVSGPLCV